MLLSDFKSNSKSLIKLWIILFCVQLTFFSISSIVVSQIKAHNSENWVWEYLTLTKGQTSLAWSWLVCNMLITIIDFSSSYGVHRENFRILRKTNSNRENIILKKMYRNLKFSLILVVVAIFMQMIHGVIWWLVGVGSLVCKFFYFKELIHLDPKIFSFKFPSKKQ